MTFSLFPDQRSALGSPDMAGVWKKVLGALSVGLGADRGCVSKYLLSDQDNASHLLGKWLIRQYG